MKRLLWLPMAALLVMFEVAGQEGLGASVAIGTDGRALISYPDWTAGVLRVVHCSDLECTRARIAAVPFAGGSASVAIGGDGLGLIAYGPSVQVAHCADVNCASATTSLIFPNGPNIVHFLGALAMGTDGRGFLTAEVNNFTLGTSLLLAAKCSNAACTSFTTATIANADLVDGLPGGAVAIGSDGRPLIAYAYHVSFPAFAWKIFVAKCQDSSCSAISSRTEIGSGRHPLDMAIGSDGLGLLAWTDADAGLRLTHCGDAACNGASTALLDPVGPIYDAAVVAGSDGLPLLAYLSGNDLKVAHCNDLACSSASTATLDGVSNVITTRLAIGADGLGLISYQDAAGVLRVAHCENVACMSAIIAVPSPSPSISGDLSLELSHFPEPVTGLRTLTYRLAASNLGPDEVGGVSVTLQLPPSVVFQSAGGDGWSCVEASGVVTCSHAVGGFVLPEIFVTVTAPPTAQVLSATASITSAVPDPVPGNNTDTELATVAAAPLAELAVAMSDGGAVVHPGLPFTWTITAANVGGGSTTTDNATVTDAFPATVSGVTWTCAASGGAICEPNGFGDIMTSVSLPIGGTATFTATGTLSAYAYVLTNTATIAPPFGSYDPNPADNTASVSSQPEPTRPYTLAPCRLVDTRLDPPALGANTTRTFAVAGTCGIPADARAVAVNVTAVNPGEVGDLRLFPTGTATPMASTLNFAPGRTRAGNSIVPLGIDGRVSVQCDMPAGSTSSTHFVLDVYAYFKP